MRTRRDYCATRIGLQGRDLADVYKAKRRGPIQFEGTAEILERVAGHPHRFRVRFLGSLPERTCERFVFKTLQQRDRAALNQPLRQLWFDAEVSEPFFETWSISDHSS